MAAHTPLGAAGNVNCTWVLLEHRPILQHLFQMIRRTCCNPAATGFECCDGAFSKIPSINNLVFLVLLHFALLKDSRSHLALPRNSSTPKMIIDHKDRNESRDFRDEKTGLQGYVSLSALIQRETR